MKHSVEEVQLKNGAKGLLIDVPNASVMNFDLEFRAGHYLVPKKKWETPHIMEHMVFGANKQYQSAREFSAEFEKNGAYNNASTDVFSLHYLAECADFEWQRVLDLLLLSVSQPIFLESEFASEFGNVREEMIGRSNNNFRLLFQKLAIAGGYISMTDRDRVKLMANVTIEDIREHYLRTHTSSNLRFVIAGSMRGRRQKIIGMLEKLTLPKGQRFEYPKQKVRKLQDVLYIRRPNIKNIYYSLDAFLPEVLTRHEERALSLLNVLLGERENSLLYGKAREQGLVYHVDVAHVLGQDNVNWGVSGQVSIENSKPFFELIKTELQKMKDGDFSAEELVAARHFYIGALQISVQKVSRLTSLYGRRYFLSEELRHFEDIPAEVQAVTKQDIADVANKLFSSGLWGLGALGNCGIAHIRELGDIVAPLWEN